MLDERREVFGIQATVVRDRVVRRRASWSEDTQDWYAQDADGNVWYLGEETAEYEGGEVVSTEGSWEAGVDGALPGIVMLADPRPGDAYRQEFYEGEAEDLAEVLARRPAGGRRRRDVRGRGHDPGVEPPRAGGRRGEALRSGRRADLRERGGRRQRPDRPRRGAPAGAVTSLAAGQGGFRRGGGRCW